MHRGAGKVVQTPEVVRVYLGSFWDAPLKMQDNRYVVVTFLFCTHNRCRRRGTLLPAEDTSWNSSVLCAHVTLFRELMRNVPFRA
jgi:EH domain-containing protein 1